MGSTPAADLRPLLFGNAPIDNWPPGDDDNDSEPWRSFIAARQAVAAGDIDEAVGLWRSVVSAPGLESRQTLQAWKFLRAHDTQPADDDEAQRVLGVVCEIPVDVGHDVLAAYRDGSARYLNFSGRAIVFDEGPAEVHGAVRAVIAAAEPLATTVDVWKEAELPPLPAADARITMLTPAGFRFGQGAESALRTYPGAADLLDAATQLLVKLVEL